MRSALWLPLFDELADPLVVGYQAAEAETAGWRGVFVWDHLRWRPRETVAFDDELSMTGEQLDDRIRAQMLDEALAILTAAWSGEPVDHRGEHYTVDGHACRRSGVATVSSRRR